MIRPFIVGFATTLKHIFKKPDHRQLPGPEDAGVPEVPRQTGADARRERAGEVRGLRPVRGGVSGRRHLPRAGGERRHASRPVRATRRSTRFTRRAASSAGTAKRPARCRRSSWARTTSSRSTATRTSSGTRPTCSCRPTDRRSGDSGSGDSVSAIESQSPDHEFVGASATFTATSDASADHRAPPRRARSGCAWATWPATTARTSRLARRSTGSKATTRTSTRSRRGALPETSASTLPNGGWSSVGVRIAGLGGTFAPSWYQPPADALPHPRKGTRASATALADRRRHFVREEVEACRGCVASTSS